MFYFSHNRSLKIFSKIAKNILHNVWNKNTHRESSLQCGIQIICKYYLHDAKNTRDILLEQLVLGLVAVHEPDGFHIDLSVVAVMDLQARAMAMATGAGGGGGGGELLGEEGAAPAEHVPVHAHPHRDPFLAVQHHRHVARLRLPEPHADLVPLRLRLRRRRLRRRLVGASPATGSLRTEGPSTAARMGSSSCAAAAAASAAEACGCRRRRGGGGCSWGSCGAPPATGSTRIPPAWRRSARPASSPRHPPSSPSSPPSHIRFFTRTSKIFLLLKRKFSARDQEHKSDKGRILLRTPTALHGREIGRTKKVWKDQQKSGVFASRKLKEQKRSLLLIGKNNTTAKWQLEIIQITDNTTQEARFHLEKPPPPQQHKEEEELQEAILVS